MAGVNISEMSQYTDADSRRFDSNTFASTSSTTTTTGKKEEGKAKKSKTLSYPLSRRQDQDTDYLEIVIAEYQAPGLELQGVDFTNTTKPSDGESARFVSTTDDSVLEFKNKAGEKIVVDSKYINKNLGELTKDTDLSKFIL